MFSIIIFIYFIHEMYNILIAKIIFFHFAGKNLEFLNDSSVINDAYSHKDEA